MVVKTVSYSVAGASTMVVFGSTGFDTKEFFLPFSAVFLLKVSGNLCK